MESTDILLVLCGRKVRTLDQEYHPETMRETPNMCILWSALGPGSIEIQSFVATKQSEIGPIARKDKS